MEEKRFWPEKPHDQSTRLRRKRDTNNYDPWANWFNAGLDPEPLNNNFNAEPYASAELVSDNFSVQPEHSDNPILFGESTQAGIWGQEQQGYNPSFFPVVEYPPSIEESVQGAEVHLPLVSGEQQRNEEPAVETNHLVWRQFPDKSC